MKRQLFKIFVAVWLVTPGRQAGAQVNPAFTYDTSSIASFLVSFNSTYLSSDTLSHSFRWTFGDGTTSRIPNVVHRYREAGIYTVWFRVSNGADADSSSTSIRITDQFFVPNVFTPNGDGVNDFFVVHSNGVTRLSLEIFDRSGHLVFKTTAATVIWDGRTPAGTQLPPGTYYYVVRSAQGENIYEKKGYLRLFR